MEKEISVREVPQYLDEEDIGLTCISQNGIPMATGVTLDAAIAAYEKDTGVAYDEGDDTISVYTVVA